MSLVSVLAVSTQAAFLHDAGWLWAINYISDLYFIADMLVTTAPFSLSSQSSSQYSEEELTLLIRIP